MSVTAAVTIITYRNKEVLLLKRAENPLDPWSGHISLPGGRIEDKDSSALEAAVRETFEECTIDLSQHEVAHYLEAEKAGLTTETSIKVMPFHFNLPEKPHINLQLEEHADYYWVNMDILRNSKGHSLKAKSAGFPDRLFPCVDINGTDLWGFTYKVLQDFFKLLDK